MSEEEINELFEEIESFKWNYENNIAYINDKKYRLVDRDLLSYIRKIEKEKQDLIEYLEDKIKDNEEKRNNMLFKMYRYFFSIRIDIYQEILDKVRGK